MASSATEILLAFDFGLRRIGVASANRRTVTASPLTTLEVTKTIPWDRIDTLIEEWHPARILVGLPDPDAARNIATAAIAFAAALGQRYGLPVTNVDETLTSRAAYSELIMARRNGTLPKRLRKGRVDSHAACLIAEQWLREEQNECRADQ
jgi:putative Holliday junction resolvase